MSTTMPAAATIAAVPEPHASLPPGASAKNRATAAIQAAGAQAPTAMTKAPGSHSGARRQAARPRTVATGAAGPARRFATTLNTGMAGSSVSRSG
ncbi:hypothetical protein GCM10025867_31780 [Frondihabitans sucicola]|uniref:Uncharacterized protein n=1 Tax=Frondihabitans sucicola TaxID=1268041 RepID=A0ABM8GR45_9MICO|nr:hypothetical protein GCM10025867_31780 [Frondihabitans sucicola]